MTESENPSTNLRLTRGPLTPAISYADLHSRTYIFNALGLEFVDLGTTWTPATYPISITSGSTAWVTYSNISI